MNALEKTYGSQFLWKIDHYSDRLQEARTNKKTTLFSPPFLSLSICLCGDGKGEGNLFERLGNILIFKF